MPTSEPVKPAGEATSAVSRKAGRASSSARTTKSVAAAPVDLDARHERITRPRRAMGPPLGSIAAGPRAATAARPPKAVEVKPTDPPSAKKSAKKSTKKRG